MQAGGAVILDARSAKAYEKSHADGAISAPSGGPGGGKAPASIAAIKDKLPSDMSAAIVVHCAAGGEAAGLKKGLKKEGYTNVINAGSIGRVKKLQK